MRRALVLIAIVSLALAACSSSSKTTQPATTTTTVVGGVTTTTAPPTTGVTTIPPVTETSTTTAKGVKKSAFIDSVNLTAHTITIDPMMFLTGQAAKTAFKKAHPTAQEGPTDDYYIVNPKVDHVVLTFPATAGVKLVQVNGKTHNLPVTAPQSTLATYASLSTHPFWLTVTGTTVNEVDEQFVP